MAANQSRLRLTELRRSPNTDRDQSRLSSRFAAIDEASDRDTLNTRSRASRRQSHGAAGSHFVRIIAPCQPLMKRSASRLCGGLSRIGRLCHIALGGAKIDNRVRADVVGADLRTLALVFAAPELAFDAHMRALLEGGGVFPKPGRGAMRSAPVCPRPLYRTCLVPRRFRGHLG